MIKKAIEDRACLTGTYFSFRVRFAPHALGRDERSAQTVIAFEYRGMTTGRSNWVALAVDRLRGLQRVSDPWRSGHLEKARQFHLTDIETAVDSRWGRPKPSHEEPRQLTVTQRERELSATFPAPTRPPRAPNPEELPTASESSSLTARSPASRRPGKFPK
jgi:hypothetical protein